MPRLTETRIESARLPPKGGRVALRCSVTTGLVLRVEPTGSKVFAFEYRMGGGQTRRYRIGKYPDWSVTAARKEAGRLRSLVDRGIDPLDDRGRLREEARAARVRAQAAPTVADLSARYMAEHAEPKKKLSSVRNDRLMWGKHILPDLGALRVAEVSLNDVHALHHRLGDRPYLANRVLSLLSKAFTLAERWGWREPFTNPATWRHHDRYKEEAKRGRSLTPEQMREVGKALDAEGDTYPAAAVRLYMLTGCRPAEIYRLRWEDVDLEHSVIRLPDSKTGPRRAFLGRPAVALLAALPRLDGNPHVFPGREPGEALYDLKAVWRRIEERAGLPEGTRLYDVGRHSFVTWAKEAGIGPDRVEILVGHSIRGDVRSVYTHYSATTLLADADRVCRLIHAALTGEDSKAEVIPFPQAG